jgi:hypothetical protein
MGRNEEKVLNGTNPAGRDLRTEQRIHAKGDRMLINQ